MNSMRVLLQRLAGVALGINAWFGSRGPVVLEVAAHILLRMPLRLCRGKQRVPFEYWGNNAKSWSWGRVRDVCP